MSEERKVRATITFLGEPAQIPEPGERVALRVADGSWREGLRCTSTAFVEDDERRAWVATAAEYATAMQEERAYVSDTWSVSQIVLRDEGACTQSKLCGL
jgi:hypothetical protein